MEFPCPECHSTVQLMRGGLVKPHLAANGHPCTFTRTANNLTSVRNGLSATPESRAALADLRSSQKVMKQESVQEQRQQHVKAKAKCPICGRMVGKHHLGTLATHKKPSGRYCTGGDQPTEEQRQAQKFRNAWRVIVPGGAPGLGKRR